MNLLFLLRFCAHNKFIIIYSRVGVWLLVYFFHIIEQCTGHENNPEKMLGGRYVQKFTLRVLSGRYDQSWSISTKRWVDVIIQSGPGKNMFG